MASNDAPARTRSRLALPDEQLSLSRSPLRAAKSANRMKAFSPIDGLDSTGRAQSEDARSQSAPKSGKRSASPPPADEYKAGTPASEDARELKRARREDDPTRRSDEENHALPNEGTSSSAAHPDAGPSRLEPEHHALKRVLPSHSKKPSSSIDATLFPSTPSHDRARSVPLFPAPQPIPTSQSIPHIDFTQPEFSPVRQRARSRSPTKEPSLKLFPASPEKAPTFELARSTVNASGSLPANMAAMRAGAESPFSSAAPEPLLTSTPALEPDTPAVSFAPSSQVTEPPTSQSLDPVSSQASTSQLPDSQTQELPTPRAPAPPCTPPRQSPVDDDPGSPLTSIPGSPLTPISPSPQLSKRPLPEELPVESADTTVTHEPAADARLLHEDTQPPQEDMQMGTDDLQMESQSSLPSRPSNSRLPRPGHAPQTRQEDTTKSEAGGSKAAAVKAGSSRPTAGQAGRTKLTEAASKPAAGSRSKATAATMKATAAASKANAAGSSKSAASQGKAAASKLTGPAAPKPDGTTASKPDAALKSKPNNAFSVLMANAKGKGKAKEVDGAGATSSKPAAAGPGKPTGSSKAAGSSKPAATTAKSTKSSTKSMRGAVKPGTSSRPDPATSSKPDPSTSSKPRSMSRAGSMVLDKGKQREDSVGKQYGSSLGKQRGSSVVSTKSSAGDSNKASVKVKTKMRGRQQPKPIPKFVYPDEEEEVPLNDEEVPLNDERVPSSDAIVPLSHPEGDNEAVAGPSVSRVASQQSMVPPPEFRFASSPAPPDPSPDSGQRQAPGSQLRHDGDVEMQDGTVQEQLGTPLPSPNDESLLVQQEQPMSVDAPPSVHAPHAATASTTQKATPLPDQAGLPTHSASSSTQVAPGASNGLHRSEPSGEASMPASPAMREPTEATAITDATNQVPLAQNDGPAVGNEGQPANGEPTLAKGDAPTPESEGRGRSRQKAQPVKARAPSKAPPRVTRSVSVHRPEGSDAGVTPATRGQDMAPKGQDQAQGGQTKTQTQVTRQARATSRVRATINRAPVRTSPRTAQARSTSRVAPRTPKSTEKVLGSSGDADASSKTEDRLVDYPTSDLSDLPDEVMDIEEDSTNVVHISKSQRPLIVQKRPGAGKVGQTFSTNSTSSKEASMSSVKAAPTKIPAPASPTKAPGSPSKRTSTFSQPTAASAAKIMPKTPNKSISVMVRKTPSPNKRARSSSLARPSSSFSFRHGARESLGILERALERVEKPAPMRPSTSMGFASDDTPSTSTTASMMQAPMTDLGPRGLKRSASADSEASLSKRPPNLVQKPIGSFFRRPGAMGGPFGHRAPKASRQPMLQTVIGSPVKAGGAPAAADEDEPMPQIQPFLPMLPPPAPEAGPSKPLVASPDEVADDEEDIKLVVPPELLNEDSELAELIERNRAKDEAARTKPRADAATMRLDARRASSAFSALSQSLSELPQKRKPGDMGPPKTPPRLGTRAGLRSASSTYPSSGEGGAEPPSAERAKGKEKERDVPEPKLDALKGCVVFIDVRTDDGNEYQDVFKLNLKRLGARVLSRLSSSCTHIVYKNGLPNTAMKFRLMDPRPKVVGIRWAVECVEQRRHVDEEGHLIDLEHVDVAGHLGKSSRPARRKSLIPQRARKESEDLDLDLDVDMDGDADVSMQSMSSITSDEDSLTPLERARLRRKMREKA
ncbi:hypothetical protein HDZ31DRAFT_34701 [Schizophyllum fasciatum]